VLLQTYKNLSNRTTINNHHSCRNTPKHYLKFLIFAIQNFNIMISKTYAPQDIEAKWYQYWLDNKHFASKPNPGKEPYSIVIPPPNVTGILHMGHMLNNTIQDVLIRKARMEGKEACWVPGTDHASILELCPRMER
jgi:arginyl-tRNA synthetase